MPAPASSITDSVICTSSNAVIVCVRRPPPTDVRQPARGDIDRRWQLPDVGDRCDDRRDHARRERGPERAARSIDRPLDDARETGRDARIRRAMMRATSDTAVASHREHHRLDHRMLRPAGIVTRRAPRESRHRDAGARPGRTSSVAALASPITKTTIDTRGQPPRDALFGRRDVRAASPAAARPADRWPPGLRGRGRSALVVAEAHDHGREVAIGRRDPTRASCASRRRT